MFKNVASQKIQLFAFDTTTGLPKTGDAANITAYVAKDYGAVTVLGDTSATEMDATNAKGWYLFDLTQAESNFDCGLFTAKSTTSNISIVGQVIYTLPASFTSFVTPTNLTAAQIATGVWQDTTAGDFTTALSVGKSVMNGVALGTGLTVNDITTKTGYSLSGTQTYNNTGTWTGNIVGTLSTLTTYTGNTVQTGDAYARLGAPAGASISADIAAAKVDTAAIKVQTDKLAFTVTNQVDANVLDWKSATAPAMTGDAFARLGAPAGASVSADVAAVKVDTAAVKVQTDKMAFTVTNVIDANVLRTNGDATSAANVAKTQRAIGRGTVNGSPTTTSIPTSAFTPNGVAADQFKGRIITFDADTTTTSLRGQSSDITASSGVAAPTFTVTALTTAPAIGDTFSVT